MSLIAIAWRAHPDYPCIVVMNRDEAHDRPTRPAAWHDGAPRWLGGEDGVHGGTWLGVTENGRFGAVTAFRDGAPPAADATTRGRLPLDFLASDAEPVQHARGFVRSRGTSGPFNLLVGTPRDVFYAGSRSKLPLALTPGIHTLSNGLLDEHWPKNDWMNNAFGAYVRDSGGYRMLLDGFTSLAHATAGREPAVRALPAASPQELAEGAFGLLGDTTLYTDGLPDTGVGAAEEMRLSATFVLGAAHGTRTSTVLVFARDAASWFEERSFDPLGEETGRVSHEWTMPAAVWSGGED